MAAKRCIPTDLFYNRKFVRLHSDTTRLILVGLITDADDAGRGLADPDLLGRKLDQCSENIQEALEDLEQAGFVQRYTQEEDTYYFLCHWYEWEKLGKPTPSRYPAPPQQEVSISLHGKPGKPGETQGTPKIPRASRSEEEGKGKEIEDEGEDRAPPTNQHGKVLSFPAPRPATGDTAAEQKQNQVPPDEVTALTKEVASILNLPITDALSRLVAEYAPLASLSLQGEADAAREWIDGPKNEHSQRMSPAFFRRWLKRECADMERQRLSLQQAALATGTTGNARSPTNGPETAGGRRPPNLMHLAEEDAQAKRKE